MLLRSPDGIPGGKRARVHQDTLPVPTIFKVNTGQPAREHSSLSQLKPDQWMKINSIKSTSGKPNFHSQSHHKQVTRGPARALATRSSPKGLPPRPPALKRTQLLTSPRDTLAMSVEEAAGSRAAGCWKRTAVPRGVVATAAHDSYYSFTQMSLWTCPRYNHRQATRCH